MNFGLMDQNKICRLCFAVLPVCYSLLEQNGSEMVESLTSIKISKDDSLPKNVCVKCWLNIKMAYRIQQTILEANRKLLLLEQDRLQEQPFNVKKEEEVSDHLSIRHESFENLTDEEKLCIIKNEDPIESDQELSSIIFHLCPICGSQIENDSSSYDHIKDHYYCEQKCDDCDIVFENIHFYRNHISEYHNSLQETWICKVCQLTFLYKPLYQIHTQNAHHSISKDRQTYAGTDKRRREVVFKDYLECIECRKTFSSKKSYCQHLKGHLKKKCPVCGMEISSYNLNRHIMLHSAGPSVCHLCGITLKNIESLRGHLYYTHSTRKFSCEHCGKVFKKLYIRNLHVKKEHTGEKSHVCDTCGKSFFTQYTLSKHVRMTHLKLRPHICRHCDKGFSSRFALRTHERQHTNEAPYKCDICGEGFRQNVSLRAHKKTKHNIIEQKMFECKICTKMFVSEWAVKSHMRLHL